MKKLFCQQGHEKLHDSNDLAVTDGFFDDFFTSDALIVLFSDDTLTYFIEKMPRAHLRQVSLHSIHFQCVTYLIILLQNL